MADYEILLNDKVKYIGFRVNYNSDSLRFQIGLVDSPAVLFREFSVRAELLLYMREHGYEAFA